MSSLLLCTSILFASGAQEPEVKTTSFYKTVFRVYDDKLQAVKDEFRKHRESSCDELKIVKEGDTNCGAEMRFISCLKEAAYTVNKHFQEPRTEEDEDVNDPQPGAHITFDEDQCKIFAEQSKEGKYRCTFDCAEAMTPYRNPDDPIPSDEGRECTADKDCQGTCKLKETAAAKEGHCSKPPASGAAAYGFTALTLLLTSA